jgi:hypothetical protein
VWHQRDQDDEPERGGREQEALNMAEGSRRQQRGEAALQCADSSEERRLEPRSAAGGLRDFQE